MALQTINIGASANDGSGDPLRTAMDKINENFALLDIVFNVQDPDFAGGADPTGAADSTAAINAAIAAIDAAGGGVLYFPKGTYKKLRTSANIVLCSNITVRGDGMGVSTIQLNDTGGGTGFAILADEEENITIENISVIGSFSQPDHVTTTTQFFQITDSDNVTITHVESAYSLNFGMIISRCTNVDITHCHVHHNVGDGIAAWNCNGLRIQHNTVHDNDDDGISAHNDDAESAPVARGMSICNNILYKTQGISALGAKNFDISHNVMWMMHAYAINVTYSDAVEQGDTPVIWGQINFNTCADSIIRPQGGNLANHYMRLGGAQRNVGTGNDAAPGMPDSVAGGIEDLYGTNTGHFYVNNTDDTAVPSPGGYNIHVIGNIMGRSRPAVDDYSDYGLGTLWPGNWLTADYDGPVEEANYANDGLILDPYLRNVKILHNTFQDVRYGIYFKCGATPADVAYWNVAIENNTIFQFSDFGINFEGTSASEQLVYVRNNEFNGDPLEKNANRGSNGTWAAGTTPNAVRISAVGGFHLEGNHYSNVAICTSAVEASGCTLLRNVVHCDPAAVGFSTSNKGVGNVPRAGASYWHIIEECDPTNAAFGAIKSPTLHDSSGRPSSGTYVPGHFVRNNSPSLTNRNHVIGWIRNTLGSGHVGATDWFDCYCTSSPGVVNQSTSTDNAVPRFNGTSGVFIENTAVIIDDSSHVSGIVNLTTTGSLTLASTITAPGTTGNQTINKPTGRVNIAAAGTTITVTNNMVTANSIVHACAATNDTTARVTSVVASAGSFVIHTVGVTAETAFNFRVTS